MSSVMTVRVAPVSRFLTATIAPPTAAPDASSTFPEIVAVTCARALSAPTATITIAITNPLNIRVVIAGLLLAFLRSRQSISNYESNSRGSGVPADRMEYSQANTGAIRHLPLLKGLGRIADYATQEE